MNNTLTVIPKGGEKILIRPEKVTMIVYQAIDPNYIGERGVSIIAEGPMVMSMPMSKFEETEFFQRCVENAGTDFVQISPS